MDGLDDVTAAGDQLVALVDGVASALDPLTGEVTWTGEPGDDLVVLRDAAGGVLVDVESGRGLDLESGEELWSGTALTMDEGDAGE